MRAGKVSESVLKRSVLRQLHTKRPEVLQGAQAGIDCAALDFSGEECVTATASVSVEETATSGAMLAVVRALNNLAAAGAAPVGVMVTVLLPTQAREIKLKTIMAQVEETCAAAQVQVLGGHTEVTDAVNRPILTVCGIGKEKKEHLLTADRMRPGMDIVLTKWVGLEGTVVLARERREDLLTRFSAPFLEKSERLAQHLFVQPEAQIAVRYGVAAMHDASQGGIFGALWEIAEAADTGLVIDMMAIPVRQETIEICEFFGSNPYKLASGGCMIMAAEDGSGLVAALHQADIPATIVGKAAEGNDRVLLHGEERRFLEPSRSDELYEALHPGTTARR